MSSNSQLVWRYDLTYQDEVQAIDDPAYKSRIVSIERCFPAGECEQPIEFGWTDIDSEAYTYRAVEDKIKVRREELDAQAPSGKILVHIFDVDGDGVEDGYYHEWGPDFNYEEHNSQHTAGQGELFWRNESNESGTEFEYKRYIYSPETQYSDVDLNRDGYRDILRYNPITVGLEVFLNIPKGNNRTIAESRSEEYSISLEELSFLGVRKYEEYQYVGLVNLIEYYGMAGRFGYDVKFQDMNQDGYLDLVRMPPRCVHDSAYCTQLDPGSLTEQDWESSKRQNFPELAPKKLEVLYNDRGRGWLGSAGNREFDEWAILGGSGGDSTSRHTFTDERMYYSFVDFNADGYLDLYGRAPDIAVSGSIAAEMVLFEHNGGDRQGAVEQNFVARKVNYGNGPNAMGDFSGDFDGDGLTDFAFLPANSTSLQIDRNTGDGFAREPAMVVDVLPHCNRYGSNYAVCHHIVVDYNNDGMDDVVETGSCHTGREVTGKHADEDLIQTCTKSHPRYRPYTAQVWLSKGVDNEGRIAFAKPIIFDQQDNPNEVDEDLGVTDFHDSNGDGMLENRSDLVSSYPGNRITSVKTANGNMTILYTALDSTGVLLSGDGVNGDLMMLGDIRSKRIQMPKIHFPKTRTHKMMAVKTLLVQEGKAHQVNIKQFHYSNMLLDVSGKQAIGFERVQADQYFYDRSEVLRSVTEFLQATVEGITLKRRVKRRQTYVIDSPAGDPTLVLDEKMQWKISIFDNPYNDTAHYFAYQYHASRQNWDLDGTAKGVAITRNYATNIFTCNPDDIHQDEILIDRDQTDFYTGGTAKEESATSCDASGEAGSPDPMTKINVKRNREVRQVGRVMGLAQVKEEAAWFGPSTSTPSGDLWSQAQYQDLSEEQCSVIEQLEGILIDIEHVEYYDNGVIHRQISHPGTSEQSTIEISYNDSGSVKERTKFWVETSPGLNFNSITASSTESFDVSGQKVLSLVNEKGHRETKIFDRVFGVEVLSRVSQPNGVEWVVNSELDIAGRLTSTRLSSGTVIQYDYRRCLDCEAPFENAVHYRQIKKTGERAEREYFDHKDRSLGVRTRGLNGEFVYQEKRYDAMGNVTYFEEPHYAGDTSIYTVNRYDVLARITSVEMSERGISTADYQGLKTVWINENGQQQVRFSTMGGLVIKNIDNHDTPIEFTYWPSKNLKTTKLDNNHDTLTCMTYNRRQIQTSLTDRNIGRVHYTINALELIAAQTDSNGKTTKTHYDQLGRPILRIDDDGGDERRHRWNYDSSILGMLDTAQGQTTSGQPFTKNVFYTQYGLTAATEIQIANKSLISHFDFDDYGRPLTTTYPSGYRVSSLYNEYGFQEKLIETSSNKVLSHIQEADARGKIQKLQYGDSSQIVQFYEPETGRLSSITSTRSSQRLMEHNYKYDNIGNLKSRRSFQLGGEYLNEDFCYDTLNRLTSTDGCGTQEYDYNSLGNIIVKEGFDDDFHYGENGVGPHALSSVGNRRYHYDQNGNMTLLQVDGEDSRTIAYSILNKPTRMARGGRTVSIDYDTDGRRVHRVDAQRGTVERNTYYFEGLYEETIDEFGITHKVHYVGDAIVMDQTIAIDRVHARYEYLHKDHLGSVVVKSSEDSDSPEAQYYSPWGERLVGGWDSPIKTGSAYKEIQTKGFAGHESLQAIGLIHMNGRVYDPEVGRFVSPDPLIQAPFNTQNYNRYTYALNNPLSAVDPTGYAFEWLNKALNFIGDLFSSNDAPTMSSSAFGQKGSGGGGNAIEMIVRTKDGRYRVRCVREPEKCQEALETFAQDAKEGKYRDFRSLRILRSMSEQQNRMEQNGGAAGAGSKKHRNPLSVIGGALKRIWALPNTILGLAYGGVGMIFGAKPVWDSSTGILRFTNMPRWMMPSALSLGHVQVFGKGYYQNPDGSPALNRFNVPVVTEETLHTRQAEVLGPLYLPFHGLSMGASLLTGGGTHNNNLLEMGPERNAGPWPWN